jgi:3',5'-cyclic AMP phosphodiesterase CpdA
MFGFLNKRQQFFHINDLTIIVSFFVFLSLTQIILADSRREAASDPMPTSFPKRTILTWKGDPSTTQAVTWQTDSSITEAFGEIALADVSPLFIDSAQTFTATTTPLESNNGLAHYHSVNFTNLSPNTLYAYRVGSPDNWSEWYQFKSSSREPEPFSFIYFGDAQNNILSLWSRTIRSAFSDAPKASFMIHAGDLVNRANSDTEWGEWFQSGGWVNGMIPSIPTPGNHEYAKNIDLSRTLTKHWRPQFTLPEIDIPGLEETVYFIDYQGARIISLNSNEKIEEQAEWLEKILSMNPNLWTVITFHHPIFSSSKGRDNEELRELWKPLFDKYQVDLVLQGHDHTYARGRNLPIGISKKDKEHGTVYVVSVSGPKMYRLTDNRWMDRAAENTQLYQIISINAGKLTYEARTVTGNLYDSFELVKERKYINKIPEDVPERTFEEKTDDKP